MMDTIAIRTKRIISLLLCCAVLLFMVRPVAAANASAEDTAGEDRVMVSIGDSYSSGEGIEPFYGQSKPAYEKVADQDWLAHRSEKSWSGRLTLNGVNGTMAENRGKNWFLPHQGQRRII